MSKYGNRKTTIDNITFDSAAEARRYQELKLLESAGHIRNLELQPKYEIVPAHIRQGKRHNARHYIADFRYQEKRIVERANFDAATWVTVVEDVKGCKTAVYQLKKALFLWRYQHIEFRET